MRILVTGGCGFIGSHLVDALLARGHAVTVMDNLSEGSMDNIGTHLGDPKFDMVAGDIRDGEVVKKAMSDVEAVVHMAAIKSVPLSIKDPELTYRVNVDGTISLLEASRDARVKRFVYASTCAIYGDAGKMPITEDTPPNPLSPYARSKLAAEESCRKFYEVDGLPTVSLRYFNVYGPRQAGGEYGGVMLKFIERLRRDQPPIIYGDGEQTRDFIYVDDAVEATVLSLEKAGVEGETINMGTGRRVSINELCEMFIRLSGKTHLRPIYREARPGDIRHSVADMTKAEKLLGFRPKVPLERGIEMLWGSLGGP